MMRRLDLNVFEKVFGGYPQIQAVYLFGSAVSGSLHEESDIDLAVFPGIETLREQKLSILTDLAREGFDDVDLVFINNEDIVLQYEAVRHNVIVYQTPSFDRGATYSKTVRQYLDFCPYLTVQREAYKMRILNGKG